jgi:hypothetical protein
MTKNGLPSNYQKALAKDIGSFSGSSDFSQTENFRLPGQTLRPHALLPSQAACCVASMAIVLS